MAGPLVDGVGEVSLLNKVLRAFIGPLAPLFELGLGAVVKWVVVQGPLVLRGCAGLCLLSFLASAVWFWYGFSGFQELFLKGISAELDDPNQNYPGIEAIVLSGLQDLPKALGSFTVSDDFIKTLNGIETAVKAADDAALPPLTVHSVGPALTDKYFMSADNQAERKRGFLFMPAILIPQKDLPEKLEDDVLKKALLKAPELVRDLRISEAVAADVCTLTEQSMFVQQQNVQSQPVQAYFITARGLIQICEGKTALQKDYYNDQFEPVSFFPSRVYFKNAIGKTFPPLTAASTHENREVSRALALTHPYIDLGGNGLVVTGCRSMSTRDAAPADAVVCLDLGLSEPQISGLKAHIERLGGIATEVSCSASPSVKCSGTQNYNRDIEQRINALAGKSRLSDFYGKIQVVTQKDLALGFTIPFQQNLGENGRSGKLIYCDINIGKIQWWNLAKGSCVGGSFLVFVVFVVLLIADYGARIHEQDRAFRTVANVMQDVPAPYIRLDSNDQFIEINDAFAKMIGYSSSFEAKIQLKDKTFESLLAQDSRSTYEAIDKNRMSGLPTNNYRITLRRVDGSLLTVVVHGAAVPNPTSPRRAIPQTFGIIVAAKADSAPVQELPKRDSGVAGVVG